MGRPRSSLRRLVLMLWLLAAIVGVVTAISAQDEGNCAADIHRAFVRTHAACADLQRDSACYGAGSAMVTPFVAANPTSFERPGDEITLEAVETLTVDSRSSAAWSVVLLRPQAGLTSLSQRSSLMLLFGTAALTNHVLPMRVVTVTAQSIINIRQMPRADANILMRAAIYTSLRADGRSSDSQWLRVYVPTTDQVGWVSAELVTAATSVDALPMIDSDSPLRLPFDEMTLSTFDNAIMSGSSCTAASSGLLLQTPNLEDAAQFMLNGMPFAAAGTVFIQADADLIVQVLEGSAVLDETVIPEGARLMVGADSHVVAPYALSEHEFAPLVALDRRVQPAPLAALHAVQAANLPTTPTLAQPPSTLVVECRYVARWSQDVRSGPNSVYSVVGTIRTGEIVFPLNYVTTDSRRWLQIQPQGWVNEQGIEVQGACLPLVESPFPVQPRTNHLALERCMPENGPIEVGQQVWLEFIPDPFPDYPTAQIATRSNPGWITVNGLRLHTRVTNPIRLDDMNFIRRFTTLWIAQAGTFRIAGRLSAYEVLCIITVSPGR